MSAQHALASSQQPEFAAFVASDWADQKHSLEADNRRKPTRDGRQGTQPWFPGSAHCGVSGVGSCASSLPSLASVPGSSTTPNPGSFPRGVRSAGLQGRACRYRVAPPSSRPFPPPGSGPAGNPLAANCWWNRGGLAVAWEERVSAVFQLTCSKGMGDFPPHAERDTLELDRLPLLRIKLANT